MPEFDDAVALANRVLDKPYIDPDGDICMLARQFLRLVEKKNAFDLLLRFEHWLSIECLHETSQDVGHCVCGWISEAKPTIGDAVRECLEHLISVSSRTEGYALASVPNEPATLADYFKNAFEASERWRSYDYMAWSLAGGPDECKHGVAKGIPCRNCDAETVKAARARLNLDALAKAEHDEGLYQRGAQTAESEEQG